MKDMKEKIKIKNKKVSVEDLAVMVAGGFDRMDKRMNTMSNEIKGVRDEVTGMHEEIKEIRNEMKEMHDEIKEVRNEMVEEFDGVKTQIMETNDRINFLAESRVTYEGHEILKSRVTRIEKFIKI
jgi:uncharacterized coiled-coil DUF342 family protein